MQNTQSNLMTLQQQIASGIALTRNRANGQLVCL